MSPRSTRSTTSQGSLDKDFKKKKNPNGNRLLLQDKGGKAGKRLQKRPLEVDDSPTAPSPAADIDGLSLSKRRRCRRGDEPSPLLESRNPEPTSSSFTPPTKPSMSRSDSPPPLEPSDEPLSMSRSDSLPPLELSDEQPSTSRSGSPPPLELPDELSEEPSDDIPAPLPPLPTTRRNRRRLIIDEDDEEGEEKEEEEKDDDEEDGHKPSILQRMMTGPVIPPLKPPTIQPPRKMRCPKGRAERLNCKICLLIPAYPDEECVSMRLKFKDMVDWDSWDVKIPDVKIPALRCPYYVALWQQCKVCLRLPLLPGEVCKSQSDPRLKNGMVPWDSWCPFDEYNVPVPKLTRRQLQDIDDEAYASATPEVRRRMREDPKTAYMKEASLRYIERNREKARQLREMRERIAAESEAVMEAQERMDKRMDEMMALNRKRS